MTTGVGIRSGLDFLKHYFFFYPPVFVGRVKSVRTPEVDGMRVRIFTVAVNKIFKGNVRQYLYIIYLSYFILAYDIKYRCRPAPVPFVIMQGKNVKISFGAWAILKFAGDLNFWNCTVAVLFVKKHYGNYVKQG